MQTLRKINWAGVLLFAALLAQAPHAAWVFLRIAPHDASWEIAIALIGAIVYAIALEGATAYFVWQDARRIATAFATFSFLHNVAYYMPSEWGVTVAGAELTVRYIISMLLISASLPIAIAAFSHVQAEARRTAKDVAITLGATVGKPTAETAATANKSTDAKSPEKSPEAKLAEAAATANKSTDAKSPEKSPEAKPVTGNLAKTRRSAIVAHLQNGWGGAHDASAIVEAIAGEFAVNPATVYRDLQSLERDRIVARKDGKIILNGRNTTDD